MTPSDRTLNHESLRRPGWGLLLLEGRALLEVAAALAAYPLLRQAPRGDGHPVLVLPAYMTSDFSTRVLRGFLRDRGNAAHGWKVGLNRGPTPETVVQFLFFDPHTPRSLRAGAASVQNYLDFIGGTSDLTPAARVIGKLYARLSYDDGAALARGAQYCGHQPLL